MKKHTKIDTSPSARKTPRFLRIGILASLALLSAGVVTAIARHESGATAASVTRETAPSVASQAVKNQAGVALRNLPVDMQTLQQRPLTPDEAQKMADALKRMANQSTDGLVSVKHADGTVEMDLQGRFQNVMLAKRNDDGTIEQACVDNPIAGAEFLGIDPQLVGGQPRTNAPVRKAPRPLER